MKYRNLFKATALALVVSLSFGTAQAQNILGTLFFTGEAAPLPAGTGLDSATGLSFPTALLVSNATGDFAADGIGFGSIGTINDFLFGGLPVDPLISIGSFSYALQSLTVVEQNASFLALSGSGTLTAAGFDSTPYLLSISVDSSGGAPAYSGTLAAVPVPGALLLFVSGLAALGVRRRR